VFCLIACALFSKELRKASKRPGETSVITGPEAFVDDDLGSEPKPAGSEEIILIGIGSLDGTKAVSDRNTSETTTEESKVPGSACDDSRPGEPYKPNAAGHPIYDRTERHRVCKRVLKHTHGVEVRVISGMPWGGMFLFFNPYTVAEFTDGPISNIEPEIRVSENTDSLHENASTRIFDDDGNEADFDDLTTVQQPEFYTDGADTDPYRWMIRMMCPPDARGGFIHDPEAERTGLLRDCLTINVPGHLEFKTGSFFRVLGPVECNHTSHTLTGPIDFRLQEGGFGCFPCGQTTQAATEDSPPTAPGGVSTTRVEQGGFSFSGQDSGHAASVYSSPGGIVAKSGNVSEIGSVLFSPDTPFTSRRLLQEWFTQHLIGVDLSGVRLQMFQKTGTSSIRLSTQAELIAQLEANLDEAVEAGLNWTII